MRLILTGILLFCAGILSAGRHVNEQSGPVKDAGALEIVTEQPVPVVNFAAKELQTYLKQATGREIPIVRKASGGKTALILGDCPSARAAGIDVSKLPEEGFRWPIWEHWPRRSRSILPGTALWKGSPR